MKKVLNSLLVSALLGVSIPAVADDIDLFQSNPAAVGSPNVLIILDNTANWNTPFSYEKSALVSVVGGLSSSFRLGVMMFRETGNGNDNVSGAYVRAAVRDMDGTNKPLLSAMVNNLDINFDKGNNATYSLAMHEAYLYFKGLTSRAGHGALKRDYAGNVMGTTGNQANNNPALAYSNALWALPGNAYADSTTTTYTSPRSPDDPCAKNYIIVISNGTVDSNENAGNVPKTLLQGLGGDTTTISLSPSGEQEFYADEYARFLYRTDLDGNTSNGNQNIITYTVDVQPGTTGNGPSHSALLKSMAGQGKGRYFAATDITTLTEALSAIFNEIQAVDSVFAAVSLPVTVNVRQQFLNQIYMGVFRPHQDASPRWYGNLKMYGIARDSATNSLFLSDRLGVSKLEAVNGQVRPDAESFWTHDSSFWAFSPSGSPESASDRPDGGVVEKGGAAQRLRDRLATGHAARTLYTCTGACVTAADTIPSTAAYGATPTQFSSTNTDITDSSLGLIPAVSISSIVRSGTTATVTTAAAHGFTTGRLIRISPADPAPANYAYGGYHTATVTGTSTFTIQVDTTPSTPDANATVSGSVVQAKSLAAAVGISTLGNGAGGSSTVATAVTSAVHGLAVNDTVLIEGADVANFNGTFTVVSVPSTTSFTYTVVSPGNNTSTTGTRTVSKIVGGPFTITALTRDNPASGTTATATATTDVAHGLAVGTPILVAGAAGAEFNVRATTLTAAGTEFTYTISTGPSDCSASCGTAQAGSTDRTTLINWVRGENNAGDGDGTALVRASVHGDVIHSQPAVINYGGPLEDPSDSNSQRNIMIYYGTNDGVFHAVKGGRATAPTSTNGLSGGVETDGYEKWGMVLPEFFSSLDRLRAQVPSISSAAPKPYFADGPVTAFTQDGNADGVISAATASDIVWLYVGMRRGGRFVYSLDVTDKDAPKVKYRISNTTTGFSELGQTWSAVRTGIARINNANVLVGVFGGGYDPGYDDCTDPSVCTRTMGRAVYVINAATGALIKKFDATVSGLSELTASIPADVVLTDRDSNGYVDGVYAADTAGRVWRFNISDENPTNWAGYKIADVGGSGADNRKFMFAPSLILGTAYDAVLIGSGDREKPFDESVSDRFYMFKDNSLGTSASWTPIVESDLVDVLDAEANATPESPANLTGGRGWMLTMRTGEKIVSGSAAALGTVFFNTNTPPNYTDPSSPNYVNPSSCTSALGLARRYAVNYKDSTPTQYSNSSGEGERSEECLNCGFISTPQITPVKLDDDSSGTPVCTGTSCEEIKGGGRRRAVFWYRENTD